MERKTHPSMIKAQELRIGNLLYTDWKKGHIVTVKEIRDTKVIVNDNDWSGLKHDEVSPIPLTPAILEKCGFEQIKEGVWNIKIYTNEVLSYSVVDPYISYIAYHGGFIKYFRDTVYLHQLQNLFYALVGEDLTVNL